MTSFAKVLINDFFQWVETKGFWSTLSSAPRYIQHLMIDRLYDWKFGTKTSRYVMLKSLNQDRQHLKFCRQCEPTPFYTTEQVLKASLQLSGLSPSDVFLIDFGCGTGRILMVGLSFGFRKTIGVECSENLGQVAEQNLQSFIAQRNKVGRFEIVVEDASHFQIPSEANMLYFFNPFNAQIIEFVVQNILASHHIHPRNIWVIYLNPRHGCIFEKHGFKCHASIHKECQLYCLE